MTRFTFRLSRCRATIYLVTKSNPFDALRDFDVASAGAWLRSGLSQAQLKSLVSRGDLVRVRRGVYATGDMIQAAEVDPSIAHALAVAAVTTTLPEGHAAVASHSSAAIILGLDLLNGASGDVITMTRPPGSHRHCGTQIIRQTAQAVRMYAADLPADHVISVGSQRVTVPARTVVDLARTLPFTDGVVAADSALRLGLATKREIGRVLESCARWPGITRARRVAAFADPRSESALESCARVVFAERGLEPPELQVELRDVSGEFIGRVDFCWRHKHTIAEADGLAKYSSSEVMITQFRRDRLLRELGYKVVHFTWRELFNEPTRVVGRVRSAFGSGTAC